MSNDEKARRAIDECAKRDTANGASSEQAHRKWSERARESEKTTVNRSRPAPKPSVHRMPIKIVVHKD